MLKATKKAEWELINLGNGCYTAQCNVYTDDETYNRAIAVKSRMECGCTTKKRAVQYIDYKTHKFCYNLICNQETNIEN